MIKFKIIENNYGFVIKVKTFLFYRDAILLFYNKKTNIYSLGGWDFDTYLKAEKYLLTSDVYKLYEPIFINKNLKTYLTLLNGKKAVLLKERVLFFFWRRIGIFDSNQEVEERLKNNTLYSKQEYYTASDIQKQQLIEGIIK